MVVKVPTSWFEPSNSWTGSVRLSVMSCEAQLCSMLVSVSLPSSTVPVSVSSTALKPITRPWESVTAVTS
jgi:hypothetical protein